MADVDPSAPSISDREAAAHEFAAILSDVGVHEALSYLNARTRHRFTGLYRFDHPTLRSVSMFDRENPKLRVGTDNPITATYCYILDESRLPFALENSAVDSRVTTHPGRERVISYCGVPILNADGTAIGSLCHFDLRPRIVPVAEIPLMRAVAPLLLPSITREAHAR